MSNAPSVTPLKTVQNNKINTHEGSGNEKGDKTIKSPSMLAGVKILIWKGETEESRNRE